MEDIKTNFLERRRQPFLTEGFYKTWERETFEIARPITAKELADPKLSPLGRKCMLEGHASETTNLLHLRYTAGEPIEKLRGDLDEVVEAWEAFAKAAGVIGTQPAGSIFGFGYRSEYLPAVLLAGLTILLRREGLLPRIDALCFGFHGADAIYEELISPFIPGRGFVNAWYHDEPYTAALNAIDSTDPAEQSALMKEAVERWYAANEGLPFHGTHKDIDDEGHGGYFGYWCFELAALCYLKDIDDSRFRNHVTYPKDLVDFARTYRAEPDRQPPPEPGAAAFQVREGRFDAGGSATLEDVPIGAATVYYGETSQTAPPATPESGKPSLGFRIAEDLAEIGLSVRDSEQIDACPAQLTERHHADQVDLQDFPGDVDQAVALGTLPFLEQAIDIYDTAYAAYDLHHSQNGSAEQREEACFNMVMAVVGWIPGPGDGIKKTLKTVNRDPERYAPLLLDAMRHTLYQAGHKVNPQAFLMESLDAGFIRSLIEGARTEVANSEIFGRRPASVRQDMLQGLDLAMANIPMIVSVVEQRVKRWLERVPKNSAAITKQATAQPGSHSDGLSRKPEMTLFYHYPDLCPVSGAPYRVVFADGQVREGLLDAEGSATLKDVPIGMATVYYGETSQTARPATPEFGPPALGFMIEEDLADLGIDARGGEQIDACLAQLTERHHG